MEAEREDSLNILRFQPVVTERVGMPLLTLLALMTRDLRG